MLYAQEMWSAYHQFLQHPNDLATITTYELDQLMGDKGCQDLWSLQDELFLRPAA